MLKRLSLLLFVMLFYLPGFCQVKETIDRDIKLIKFIPDESYPSSNSKQIQEINKKYSKKNHAYREIVALDTLAIPYLIDKLSDTTDNAIQMTPVPYCAALHLKVGDVALYMLNKIIPLHLVDGDIFDSGGGLCGYLTNLHQDRIKFQKELRNLFASSNGRIMIRILKVKMTDAERQQLIKQLKPS